jgi:hypothetical protein
MHKDFFTKVDGVDLDDLKSMNLSLSAKTFNLYNDNDFF